MKLKPYLFLNLIILCSTKSYALDEYSSYNRPIVEEVLLYVNKQAGVDVTPQCTATAQNKLNEFHNQFRYANEPTLLATHNSFWGGIYFQLGYLYQFKKCKKIALELYAQSLKNAKAENNEKLIDDITYFTDGLNRL